jgi:transposase
MRPKRHPSARTTPRTRREIQARSGTDTDRQIAHDLGVDVKTVAKWKNRAETADLPMGPKKRVSPLTPLEEATVILYRRHMPLTLDETLGQLKPLIPRLTRSSLQRCLARCGVDKIPKGRRRKLPIIAKPMGFDHFVLEVYKMPSKEGETFVYFAIGHLTKHVHAMEMDALDSSSAAAFLKQLIAAAPFKTHTIMVENHPAFKETELDPWSHERPWYGHSFRMTCWQNKVSPDFKPASGFEPKPIGYGWPKIPKPKMGRRYRPPKERVYYARFSVSGRISWSRRKMSEEAIERQIASAIARFKRTAPRE